MDKKNTMLLTVIAVATLLVAVVGATFAYFAIGATATDNAKTTVTGSTEDAQVGSVALTGKNNIDMKLTAEDMSFANKGQTFYADGEGTAKSDQEHKITVGTATLEGGSEGVKYSCVAEYKVTYSDSEAAISEWTENDAAVLKLYGDEHVTVSESEDYTAAEGFKLSELKEAADTGKNVKVTFKLEGTTTPTANLLASLAIKNSEDEQQDRLANKKFTITLESTSFKCDTVKDFS